MEEGDSVEDFNPWSRQVNLLEKVLNNHDSIRKASKDDREAVSIGVTASVEARASKPKFGASKVEVSKETKAKVETRANEEEKVNQQQFKQLIDSNSNLKQREGGRNMKQKMDQSKDVLETEIEEMWELIMKESKWRKMVAAASKIN